MDTFGYHAFLLLLIIALVANGRSETATHITEHASSQDYETAGSTIQPWTAYANSTTESVDPCDTNYNITLDVNGGNLERYSWYKNCLDWPAMRWTSFLDSEGHPLDIVSFTQADGMCIEPHQCDSIYPWYLYTHTGVSLTNSDIQSASLCMTDQTNRQTNLCCLSPIQISVKKCTDDIKYMVHRRIPTSICGQVCLSQNINHADSVKTWISDSLVTYSTHRTRQLDTDMTDDERNNIVTITLAINYEDRDSLQEVELGTKLRSALVAKYNEYILAMLRYRRNASGSKQSMTLRDSNIVAIHGSPRLDELILYFSFYIRDDAERVVSSAELMQFMEEIQQTDVIGDMKSRVMNVSSGIASQIKEKYSLIPEFTEAPPSIDKQENQDDADYSASGPRSKDWIYILVILCVTIAVGLLMVIVTVLYYNCCYTKTVDLQKSRAGGANDSPRVTLHWNKRNQNGIPQKSHSTTNNGEARNYRLEQDPGVELDNLGYESS